MQLNGKCSSIAIQSRRWLNSLNGRITTTMKNKLQQHGGTAVLLIHNGQPRTSVYAAECLATTYHRKYSIPPFLSRDVLSALFKERIAKCLRNSQDFPYLDDTLRIFSRDLELALGRVIPECGPVTCRFATDAYNARQGFIADNLHSIMKEESAIDRLVVVVMHPLDDHRTVRPLMDGIITELSRTGMTAPWPVTGDSWHDFVANDQRCVAFSYLMLTELGAQEAFIKCWAQELVRLYTPDVDGIIFAVPSTFRLRRTSREKLRVITERIVREVHTASQRIVTRYRLAYYPSWLEFFAVPHRTLADRLANLRTAGHQGTVLVVPLANLFDDFDTQTILPMLLHDLEGVRLVALCEVRGAMLNTLVELLKARIALQLSQR